MDNNSALVVIIVVALVTVSSCVSSMAPEPVGDYSRCLSRCPQGTFSGHVADLECLELCNELVKCDEKEEEEVD